MDISTYVVKGEGDTFLKKKKHKSTCSWKPIELTKPISKNPPNNGKTQSSNSNA
jgi:hypothetical protein